MSEIWILPKGTTFVADILLKQNSGITHPVIPRSDIGDGGIFHFMSGYLRKFSYKEYPVDFSAHLPYFLKRGCRALWS